MKISIIIPVYNAARYLAECLDSVLAQSFDEWECLLVDDGSTDGSGAICDSYASLDRRFRVFHTANSGVSAARNLGIGRSRGSYIAFVDSDDWIERDYLSQLLDAIEGGEVQLALCGMKIVRENGVELREPEPGAFSIEKANADRFVDLNRKHLLYGPYVKLYRSDIVLGGAVRFPKGIHFGEDLMFNFDYLEHVRAIAATGEALYNYRAAHTGTLSSSHHSRDFATNYRQWKIVRRFFERRGIGGAPAAEFLSNRLWGLAYDTAMSRRMSIKELGESFDADFIRDLRSFESHSIALPRWLKKIILKRLLLLVWLIQRKRKG